MDATIEPLFTAHHGVVIDHAARVGAGVAVDPWTVPTDEWSQSRRDLDVELRVLGYAVVALLPAGRFLAGPAPDEPWRLWSEDGLPVYAAGVAAVENSPSIPYLLSLLEE